MGATNSTLNYQLSQFVATDKPAWLQDYNGDMEKIDAGINTAKVAADTAQNTANSAVSSIGTVSSDISALQTDVLAHTNDITDLQGDVNTIESLIGNGTPTAGDHTLIGAINTNTGDITNINNNLPDLRTDSSDSHADIDYYKIKDVKIVSLSVHNLDKAANTPIFTLPSGYRPATELTRFFYGSVNGSATAIAVKIKTTGEIVPTSSWTYAYGNITVAFE